MKQEHHPWDSKTYNKGANTAVNKELLGLLGQGEYIDARNARPSSTGGEKEALQKIDGEEKIHSNDTGRTGYTCILATQVRGRIFEIWVDGKSPAVDPSLIKVDGVTVLESALFPLSKEHPIKSYDVNDNCLGGEVFITDGYNNPMAFDVQDMLDAIDLSSDNYDPEKYFSNFNINTVIAILEVSLDQPAYAGLVSKGGDGLAPGNYAYSIRYSTTAGDRTPFSVQTPYISVPNAIGSTGGTPAYPSTKTVGTSPSIVPNTNFGIKIRIRVNNIADYDFIEVRRVAANTQTGLEFAELPFLVGQIDIVPGEISVIEWDDDNTRVATPLNADTDADVNSSIESVEALRYFDNKLVYMGIKLNSRDLDKVDMKFDMSPNGEVGYPYIEKIGKDGHKDNYNHTYKRTLMHGEKYGIRAVLRDSIGVNTFAASIKSGSKNLDNIQIPNRRDPVSADTAAISPAMVTAARTNLTTGKCHEVFDLSEAVTKANRSMPANILADGGDYAPLHPVSPNDGNVTGLDYRINIGVDGNNYNPRGFGPTYYSTGIAVQGVRDIPTWAKTISFVRTKPANRVICQGIGMYSMIPVGDLNVNGTGKHRDRMWFFSPDIHNGYVNSNIADNLANGTYKIQLVSPLGFFSEVWGGNNNPFSPNDSNIDIMSYARIVYENGFINPGAGIGFTEYGKWRNPTDPSNPLRTGTSPGNNSFTILTATPKTDGRNMTPYLDLTVNGLIYNESFMDYVDAEFNDEELKAWHEPFYIVNIIQEGAELPDNNINDYIDTGVTIKLEAIIGKSENVAANYWLVSERKEDCVTYGANKATDNRYVYIDGRPWINITHKTDLVKTTILNSLAANGKYVFSDNGVSTTVYGVYTHLDVEGNGRYHKISFSESMTGYSPDFFIPATDAIITVKYDTREPIKIFGGDATIAETVFCPLDRTGNSNGNEENQFYLQAGFPYRTYNFNENYKYPEDANPDGGIGNSIQDFNFVSIGFIRQMAIMFCCETRFDMALAYSHPTAKTQQSFPQVNYIIRPNEWDDILDDNYRGSGGINHGDIYDAYKDDYPNEHDYWVYGGFRLYQQANRDYGKVPLDKIYQSKPKVGFKEQTDFCTMIKWSVQRDINVQNAPGLRTFPALNTIIIDDRQGAIVYAYDATTGKGSNLYAITEHGICLLITRKTYASDLNGSQIDGQTVDNFIHSQYWLTKDVGIDKGFWKGAAEGFIPFKDAAGAESLKEALFFPSKDSIFIFSENGVKDIGRSKYYPTLFNELISLMTEDSKVTAVYNKNNREYWINADGVKDGVTKTYVYNQDSGLWTGYFDYNFDRLCTIKNKTFGSKNLDTYELGVGLEINGESIIFEATNVSSPANRLEKEYARFRANSNVMPTKVEFMEDVNGPIMCSLESTGARNVMKNYDGFEQGIPRKNANVSPARDRVQGRLLIYKIIHNLAEPFVLIDTAIQYKTLK